MRILHYSLGFPPYRSGGLTKFCTDLMKEQIKLSHEVGLLWPGEIKLTGSSHIGSTVSVRKRTDVSGIESYEVINPLPVSYDEGIKDIDAFIIDGDSDVYEQFLREFKPDVIHVHTLMGLHKSLLTVAKKMGIRLVFTTHDFFPICPKVTLFRHGKICDSVKDCEKCGVCNNTALSIKKIVFLQSPAYRTLKDSAIVKKMRKHHRDEYLSDDRSRDEEATAGKAEDYLRLRNHYREMLSLMDVIHFNSTISKEVYEQIFKFRGSKVERKVIPITHADISDNRKKKEFDDDMLRIRYLGAQSAAKGYYILKEALDGLYKETHNFILDVHFEPTDDEPYLRSHDRFGYDDLATVFDETDVLICPSIWNETFGFTVAEALSYGVPVILSGTVGAKDILAEGAGIVIEDINTQKISDAVKSLSREKLIGMNDAILERQRIMSFSEMAVRIYDDCYL